MSCKFKSKKKNFKLESLMTSKFIRNILVVMIELVINLSLVLMKCKLMTLPLSLTNPLHFQYHFMNLNSEVELLFIEFLLLKFEYCQNHYKGYEFTSEFVESAIHRSSKCIRLHKVSLNHLVFDITIKCALNILYQHKFYKTLSFGSLFYKLLRIIY